MKIIILLTLFFGAVVAADAKENDWENFKLHHNKSYANETEEQTRMQIYLDKLCLINKHNQVEGKSFKLGVNKYSDLELDEIVSTMNGFRPQLRRNKKHLSRAATFLAPANVVLPKEIDWRKRGFVTLVKDQGQCGSCWAFSATGSLEGQHFRKTPWTGQLVSLSEQNLMDCSYGEKYGNYGCNGGMMDNAFLYIQDNEGIDTEVSYPYEAVDGKCRYEKANIGATDKGYVDIPTGREDLLKMAVATVGPISVAIDASHGSFQSYSEGIYYEEDCSSTDLDHGVLVVGYGTEDDQDYWLVKNSWGTTWGMNGYIKMARNRNNTCGIATCASYPLV